MRSPGNKRDDSSQEDWERILFPRVDDLASPNIAPVPRGPFGGSRLATTDDLAALLADDEKHPDEYLHLFDAYAVVHDPLRAVALGGLPIPLGKKSPNGLVVGRSGAGKTQNVTLAAAVDGIHRGNNLVYLNIKGKAQTRWLRSFAKKCGRESEVSVVAPGKPDRSCGWTALDGCHDLSVAADIALCLVACAAGSARDGEGRWAYSQAQEFIQHAIAAICTDLPPAQRNLVELRQVVISGAYKHFADVHPSFAVLRKFAKYEEGGNRNAETVAATISEATAFIDDIAPCLSVDELDLAAFAREGGILILEIDESDVDRLRSFSSLFLRSVITALQQQACEAASGCLPHKTLIIIDELAAAGPVPGIWNALHTCRERGFYFVNGLQSVSQLPAVYGTKADIVLEGHQTQIAMGGGLDLASAEYFSRKSGATTILVPSVVEHLDNEGIATTRHWQMASRPLLMPSDIASPPAHPIYGWPATIFLGNGTTPPFQAYLTPAHQVGHLARMMDEVREQKHDDDLRGEPLKAASCATAVRVSDSHLTDVSGWTEQQIMNKLANVKQAIDWANTTGVARKWWESFEQENSSRFALVLRLAEELAARKATITEYFLAFVYACTDNIQAVLYYLDYRRLKKEAERKAKASKRAKDHPDSDTVLEDGDAGEGLADEDEQDDDWD